MITRVGLLCRLYGNARTLRVKPVLQMKVKERLARIFSNLSIPSYNPDELACEHPFSCTTKEPACR